VKEKKFNLRNEEICLISYVFIRRWFTLTPFLYRYTWFAYCIYLFIYFHVVVVVVVVSVVRRCLSSKYRCSCKQERDDFLIFHIFTSIFLRFFFLLYHIFHKWRRSSTRGVINNSGIWTLDSN